MASRRKSSNPTNRRSLNFKSSSMVEEEMRDEDSDDEQLTIPPDLFHDFLQLKTSTHLNTSELMRKLLHEYNSQSQSQVKETISTPSNPSTPLQSDGFRNEAVDYEIVAESEISGTCPPEDMDTEQPLDLSLEKSVNSSRRSSPDLASPSLSMHLPTITMSNNHLPFIKNEHKEILVAANQIKTEPGLPLATTLVPSTRGGESHVVFNGIGNLIAVPFYSSAANFLEQAVSRLPPDVQVPIKQESPQPPKIPDPPPLSIPTPSPRGRKPGRRPRGANAYRPGKTLPGEMKIIAENTLFPGVYTSILKLPWSRRSRNKPPLTQQKQDTRVSGMIRTPPAIDSSVSLQSETLLQSTAGANPNNTLLLPASSQTIMSATTSQSVMMVYPNATISAVGKPVRRRGRPPKLPMLSHLLSEKKVKKLTADTNVTNVQDLNRPIPIPVITEAIPYLQCNPLQVTSQIDVSPKLEIPSPLDLQSIVKIEPPSPPEATQTPTIISDVNAMTSVQANGAVYQEMVLPSLANIRPRRRQSTEIKNGSDFMWTSFKIKPRGGRSAKTSERRKKASVLTVSEPSIKLDEDVVDLHQQQAEMVAMDTEDSDTPNMFQELFHCKICNAILPADSKLLHQREHRPTMVNCCMCSTAFVSYFKTDNDAHDIKCDKCLKLTSSTNSPKSKFFCDLCDGRFKSFHAYDDHRHKVHGVHGNEKITLDTHSCEECGKIFFTTKGLNHHMKTHLDKCRPQGVENGSKLFQSTFKPLDFSVEADEESEVLDVEDGEISKDFVCVSCSQVFPDTERLGEHIHSVHPEYLGESCPLPGCDLVFLSEKELGMHILTHQDEKPLKCELCDYRCRQKNAMSWHMRKHPESAYKYRKYPSSSNE